MNATMRRVVVATAAVSMAVSLAACGSAKEADKSKDDKKKKTGPLTIGLLLPEDQTARYEAMDHPLIEKEIKAGCADCEVIYANAKSDLSAQQQQVDSMITKEVDVIILDSVDSKGISKSVKKADKAGIPVVAYDRLAEGPVSAYTSFDNEKVGKVQGEALLKALGKKAKDGKVVMLNGWAGDPNAALFKKGALSVLEGKVDIAKKYDVDHWLADEANKSMTGAINSLGKDNIIGVYSANDTMAGGAINALKAGGVKPLPPVTGQDAELAAVQRVLAGTQYMSVYKPYGKEAVAAAKMALALGRGEKVPAETTADSPTKKKIPATLIPPMSMTKDNIKDTVVKDGLYKVSDICKAQYKAACDELGIK
ncbi:substrate-binding domain-containing protein [Streptomyces sp. ME19-01-6]|uniref:substrate-binding domain-containing protein n=1 Tax=Streptomyces sp. ME19-01-6 TaxID=3028686 RepID=UPI0029AD2F55|nr:substrate-binding domain-containing protein [Streptomyces sp. ME19-01-6]MDX3231452.1 substrate-binding domain-containing protein [Streptomyces sp. ME19-01-6]